MSVNKAILVGRVGANPETRFTAGGQSVTNLRIATTEKYKNRQGDKVEKTEWHRLTFWGKLSEIVQQYVTKGMLIYVEGKISTNKYTKDGVDHYSTGITVREMRMLGGGERDQNAGPRNAAAEEADPSGSIGDEHAGPGPEISDEDIPF